MKTSEKKRASVRSWRERNRERVREYNRKWHHKNKEKRLASARKWRGLPEPTRPCPDFCECCGGPPNGRGSLHLDHDHETGMFRGWICSNCNGGIGKLGDNLSGVMKAVEYLRSADGND